jgi:hypothetical protein
VVEVLKGYEVKLVVLVAALPVAPAVTEARRRTVSDRERAS